MNHLQKRFDELLLEAIDEILSSLGEPVKNYLYIHLENDFGIKKHEIPGEIVELSKMLHRIYGLCAYRLEIRFMENLYSKIKVSLECPELKCNENDISFVEYVIKMRENVINSG